MTFDTKWRDVAGLWAGTAVLFIGAGRYLSQTSVPLQAMFVISAQINAGLHNGCYDPHKPVIIPVDGRLYRVTSQKLPTSDLFDRADEIYIRVDFRGAAIMNSKTLVPREEEFVIPLAPNPTDPFYRPSNFPACNR